MRGNWQVSARNIRQCSCPVASGECVALQAPRRPRRRCRCRRSRRGACFRMLCLWMRELRRAGRGQFFGVARSEGADALPAMVHRWGGGRSEAP